MGRPLALQGKAAAAAPHLKCGHDFHASVICDRCKQPIVAADMRYRLAYDPKASSAPGPAIRRPDGGHLRLFSASTSLNRMILPDPVRGISATRWVASGIL